MRKIAIALLFGVFTGLLAYVSGIRLYEWYQTGQLAVHKKMSGGLGVVTYSGDPVGFLLELTLYVFLVTMGAFGVLMACRDIMVEVIGPQNFDLQPAYRLVTIFTLFLTGLFLIVFAFGMLHLFLAG